MRSCYRNKLCTHTHGLNPKLSAWFPPSFKPFIKGQNKCQWAEYR